jgi:hypothetical protein
MVPTTIGDPVAAVPELVDVVEVGVEAAALVAGAAVVLDVADVLFFELEPHAATPTAISTAKHSAMALLVLIGWVLSLLRISSGSVKYAV